MAGVKTPTSFTAGRKISLNGTTYQPGDTIPVSAVAGLRRLTALLSRGWIKGNVERRGRTRVSRHPAPASFTPRERQGFDVAAPSTPAGVAAVGAVGSVTVTWTANASDTTAYRVRRGGTLVGTVNHPTATFTDTVAAGTYTYTVSAVDAGGNESAPSAGVTGTAT